MAHTAVFHILDGSTKSHTADNESCYKRVICTVKMQTPVHTQTRVTSFKEQGGIQSKDSVGLQFSSVQLNCSVLFDSLQPHRLQHTRLPCPSPTPRAFSNSCPSSWWHHPTISSSQSSPSLPAFNLSQNQGLFKWVRFSHQVAKVLEFQLLFDIYFTWLLY